MSSGKWRPFCLGLNVLIAILLRLIIFLYEFWASFLSKTEQGLGQWEKKDTAKLPGPWTLAALDE